MADPDRTMSPRALGAALPDLILGAAFLITWIEPTRLGPRVAEAFLLVMLLEFIVVHSGGFAGTVALSGRPRGTIVRGLAGLGLFYSLFVGGFCLAFRTWWPLASFWGLMLNRMAGVLLGQAERGDEQAFARRGWAAGALFYLGFASVTVFLPVPRLGLTPDAVSALDLPGSGLWVSQPWRVMAFGFLYFTFTGISGLREHRWFADGVPARGEAAA